MTLYLTRNAAHLLALTSFVLLAASPAASQPQPDSARAEPLYAVQMGAVVQVVAQASGEAGAPTTEPDGFLLQRIRLSAEGTPAVGLAYEIEADFAEGFELRDAYIDVRLAPGATVRVGQFKAPFSHSYLTSSSRIPFVRRPRVVGALGLGRRIGAEVRYRPHPRVTLRGGAFDAAPPGTPADERAQTDARLLLYVGRASWERSLPAGRLSLGANAAYDASRGDASGEYAGHTGLRYGADLHAEWRSVFVTLEALGRPADEDRSRADDTAPYGAYLTLGYAFARPHRLRAQLDHLARTRSAAAAPAAPRTVLGLGYTFAPDGPLRLEVDYLTPLSASPFSQSVLLLHLQLRV